MTTLEEIREQRVALGSENFHSGIRFEYKIFSLYKKKRNTLMVVRTAASHSLVDIICWTKDAKVIMISCKKNGYQTPKEIEGLKKLKAGFI